MNTPNLSELTTMRIGGPIKEFAVTLAVGILVSMFTAILGTHGIFNFLIEKIEKSGNMNRWFGIRLEGKE